MAKIYANLVIAGRKNREDIPHQLVTEVGIILLEKGFIDEQEFKTKWQTM